MPGALAEMTKTRAPTCDPSMWMELLTACGLPAADQGPQASILAKMAEHHGLLLPSSRSPMAHYCSVTNPPRFKERDGDPTSAGGSAMALHWQPCNEITTKLH